MMPETHPRVLAAMRESKTLPRLPMQIIGKYSRIAAGQGRVEQLEDGSWFATVPNFPGVWTNGDTEEEALSGLRSVVLDWAVLKVEDRDHDLPVIDGIDLNVL